MPKLYTAIVDEAQAILQDTGVIFLDAEFDNIMSAGLERISEAKPWQYKLTKTTTASSRDITLTTGDKWRLVDIKYLEFLIDKDPRQFRKYSRFGDVLTIGRDTLPTGESIYLYLKKVHLLQSALGTTNTVWAIVADTATGVTSLSIDAVAATGAINEMTTLMVTGDTTVYYVTASATIATNAATVSIWPPLAAAAAENAVVTISLTGSTLDMTLERLLARWLAAQAAISKATLSYSQVNTAITTIANAATAIAAIAARITQAVADAASGRAQAVLGATAIPLANTEFDKIPAVTVGPLVVAASALASGASLINTVTVGGGAGEYMGQAAADLGLAQGYAMAGQVYLQEASADHANAAQYFNAAAAELRAAGEKAQEANANLSLVASRLRVSDGGRNYEAWGRAELAKVEKELDSMNNYPHSTNYARD